MTLPASPTDRSGQVQDPPSGGDLCRVGARPVGPSDSPGVVFKASSGGASVSRGDVSGRVHGLVQRWDRAKASSGRLSRMRRTILRNEKRCNHGPAPRAPRKSGSPRGTRWTDVPLSRERSGCQGRAAGSVLASAGGTPLADTRALDPLIQLRCLTNPRLAPRHRRNAGWMKRPRFGRAATHVIFSTDGVFDGPKRRGST